MAEAELTITFEKERETKNTVRFAEVVAEEGDPTQVGTIYISKSALKELRKPERVVVTIRPG